MFRVDIFFFLLVLRLSSAYFADPYLDAPAARRSSFDTTGLTASPCRLDAALRKSLNAAFPALRRSDSSFAFAAAAASSAFFFSSASLAAAASSAFFFSSASFAAAASSAFFFSSAIFAAAAASSAFFFSSASFAAAASSAFFLASASTPSTGLPASSARFCFSSAGFLPDPLQDGQESSAFFILLRYACLSSPKVFGPFGVSKPVSSLNFGSSFLGSSGKAAPRSPRGTSWPSTLIISFGSTGAAFFRSPFFQNFRPSNMLPPLLLDRLIRAPS